MGISVSFSEDFIEKVNKHAQNSKRSPAEQIEFYYKVAAAAEANPELSFSYIFEIFREMQNKSTLHYRFDEC